MYSQDFCYWLQGLFELAEPSELNAKQTQQIKDHLNLVFVHEIDLQAGGPEVQTLLNKIHSPAKVTLHGDPKARC